MNIKAILFDKDGTLLEFDAFWVAVCRYTVKSVLNKINCTEASVEAIMERLGVKNGKTDADGVLCKGTYAQAAEAMYEILKEYNDSLSLEYVISVVETSFEENVDKGEIKPICPDIRGVLEGLKNKGMKLFVVTNDNEYVTNKCLCELGILDLFDGISVDDGVINAKPHPQHAISISEKIGVPTCEMLMVGDTAVDAQFAKNAGMHFAFVGDSEKINVSADYFLPNISYIEMALAEEKE